MSPAPKSIPVTPPQQPVKSPTDPPGRDEPSPALATSTPIHSQSSCFEAGMAIDTPPTSSDGEGNISLFCPWF